MSQILPHNRHFSNCFFYHRILFKARFPPFNSFTLIISKFLKVRENKIISVESKDNKEIYVNDVFVNGMNLCLGYLSFKSMVAHTNQCLKGNLNILSRCLLIQKKPQNSLCIHVSDFESR